MGIIKVCGRQAGVIAVVMIPLLALAPCLVWLLASPAFADESLMNVAKASQLIGKDVKNTEGKDLGEIKDIVLDPIRGDIEYAVLSFGGFLVLGDKYFAIPWQALRLSQDRGHFILKIDQKKLEKAPGFDKDNWPDMSDRNWMVMVYNFYELPPKAQGNRTSLASDQGQRMTVQGEVQTIQGEFYVVKDRSGKEVRMHVDQDTKISGNIKEGDKIEAEITQASHAQSIHKQR